MAFSSFLLAVNLLSNTNDLRLLK